MKKKKHGDKEKHGDRGRTMGEWEVKFQIKRSDTRWNCSKRAVGYSHPGLERIGIQGRVMKKGSDYCLKSYFQLN